MKNLDLNNYGVQEMNAKEMKETDGGNLLYDLFLVYGQSAIDGYMGACGAVVSGYESGRYSGISHNTH